MLISSILLTVIYVMLRDHWLMKNVESHNQTPEMYFKFWIWDKNHWK